MTLLHACKPPVRLAGWRFASTLAGSLTLAALSACQNPTTSRPQALPPPVQEIKVEPTTTTPQALPQMDTAPMARAPVAPVPTPAARATPKPSNASNAKAYRMDAAAHLYELNKPRIYLGRLPANLYAIGVLDVELNARGQVLGLKWQRAPQAELDCSERCRASSRQRHSRDGCNPKS